MTHVVCSMIFVPFLQNAILWVKMLAQNLYTSAFIFFLPFFSQTWFTAANPYIDSPS